MKPGVNIAHMQAWLIAAGFLSAASGMAGCTLLDYYGLCAIDLPCYLESKASSSGSMMDAGADADSGPPPACIPSLANAPVDDSCGIFVSSSLGDDSNAGNTKSAPVKTLKQALLLGAQQNLPVYACAEDFVNGSGESLNVSAGSVLFGGLDCTGDWSYAGGSKKSVVQGAADVVAAVLRTGSETTRIEDFVFRAPDATVDGGSSIAVLSEPILNVVLARCDLIAGHGKDGAKGLTPTDDIGPSDANDMAIKGGDGNKAAPPDLGMPNPGGAGAVNALCPTSIGGEGGDGSVANGGNGTDGAPMLAFGAHGVGEPAMGAWNCIAVGNGQGGDNGTAGTQGESAKDNELGSLDLNGFVSAAGKPGTEGAPGQGGGGAGAAKGKTDVNGASGGGGGAGGCGGKGGGGGQGGGAGIALVSLGTSFVFTSVSLSAGNGGRGGDGTIGQVGAVGGLGGAGGTGDPNPTTTADACTGGQGGKGGQGGPGGAGRGGHSLGIAHTGTAPSLDGLTFSLGTPGMGGTAFMSSGADGVQANLLAFP